MRFLLIMHTFLTTSAAMVYHIFRTRLQII